jgi:pilus assembly protein Flp/PilA
MFGAGNPPIARCMARHPSTPSSNREHQPANRGAASVEYALLIGLIALTIILAVALLGTNLLALFQDAASSFA